MSPIPALRNPARRPTHPGVFLKEEVIPATGRTVTDVARLLVISRQQLYDILNGRKPVSPTTAAKLGKLFGNGTGFWTRMQAVHDTWVADREVDVSKIETLDFS